MGVRTVHKVDGAAVDMADHPPVKLDRLGVLLVNLGTPESTDVPTVRRYLREFLSDPRVIEVNPWLWKPILYGIILTTRPPKTAEAYRQIWMEEHDESPLRHYTRLQAEMLQERMDPSGETLMIDWAMRYGVPRISDRLAAMTEAGCDKIVIVPLYPQYSASTTASVNDAAFDALKTLRWQPAKRPTHITSVLSLVYQKTLSTAQNVKSKCLTWCQPQAVFIQPQTIKLWHSATKWVNTKLPSTLCAAKPIKSQTGFAMPVTPHAATTLISP